VSRESHRSRLCEPIVRIIIRLQGSDGQLIQSLGLTYLPTGVVCCLRDKHLINNNVQISTEMLPDSFGSYFRALSTPVQRSWNDSCTYPQQRLYPQVRLTL
jgi:hypothetical protein